MSEKKNLEEEQKYIEKLVQLGKKISQEASRDRNLEERIKRLSSY